MSGMSAFRCTPRQVRSFTVEILMAGLVPFIRSSPGMGKSAIVKSIAERHRGKVWVESELGRGSTFFLQIPLTQPKEENI